MQGCVFYNNNNDEGFGNGSAIYVEPRGSIRAISDSVFKYNGIW